MDDKKYAQIQYDAEDLENIKVSEIDAPTDNIPDGVIFNELRATTEAAAEYVKAMVQEERIVNAQETGSTSAEETVGCSEEPEAEVNVSEKEIPKDPSVQTEQVSRIEDQIDNIYVTMRRLEKKFEAEILNAQNRDSAVKSIYKELNEYKAGLVEKALKNVMYDVIDIREMMFAKIKAVKEKSDKNEISLEEFEFFAESIGDILEKHDVGIYKGEPGLENIAIRQKIVKKTETEDESLIKKVAESLSYGYEYNGKVLYPEKINIYVKKK